MATAACVRPTTVQEMPMSAATAVETEAAVVTVSVSQFHRVNGTHKWCKADVTLTTATDVVSQSGPNAPIVVTGKVGGTVWIEFVVTDGSDNGTTGTYVPVGIGFKDQGSVDGEGLQDFPVRKVAVVDGITQLTIKDRLRYDTSFDFDLIIQRSSDGDIGIIDPMVTNQTK